MKETTYTKEQKAIWKKTHRDFKLGTLRGKDAMVMRNGGAQGCILVPLESLGGGG